MGGRRHVWYVYMRREEEEKRGGLRRECGELYLICYYNTNRLLSTIIHLTTTPNYFRQIAPQLQRSTLTGG